MSCLPSVLAVRNRPRPDRLQGIDLQHETAYLQPMDWDKLQYFLSVAHHGTLARAAQALHVDPTTVSRRVSSLEADLQQTLFERAPAGFVLTAARSEEHTSELQSLMRTSYAVFCLKKKTNNTPPNHTPLP